MKTLIITFTLVFISVAGGASAKQCQAKDESLMRDIQTKSFDVPYYSSSALTVTSPAGLEEKKEGTDIPPALDINSYKETLISDMSPDSDNYADKVEYEMKSAFYTYSFKQKLLEDPDTYSDNVQSQMNKDFDKYNAAQSITDEDDPIADNIRLGMNEAFDKYVSEHQAITDDDNISDDIQAGMAASFYAYTFTKLEDSYKDEANIDDIPFSTIYFASVAIVDDCVAENRLNADGGCDIPSTCKIEFTDEYLNINCDNRTYEIPASGLQYFTHDMYQYLLDILIKHSNLFDINFMIDTKY